MATLSNEKKRDIVRAESYEKFHDKLSKAKTSFLKELDRLAEKETPDWVTDEIRESGMLKTTCYVDVEGMEDDENYCAYRKKTRFSSETYFPKAGYGNILVKASKTLLSRRKKVVDIEEEKNTFQNKLRKVLSSVNTDKKLREYLPELAEYAEVTGGKSMLPMPVDQIKEMRQLLS